MLYIDIFLSMISISTACSGSFFINHFKWFISKLALHLLTCFQVSCVIKINKEVKVIIYSGLLRKFYALIRLSCTQRIGYRSTLTPLTTFLGVVFSLQSSQQNRIDEQFVYQRLWAVGFASCSWLLINILSIFFFISMSKRKYKNTPIGSILFTSSVFLRKVAVL